MTLEQAQQLLPDMDWEEVLLEVQTDPGDGLTENHGRLYEAIYGLLETAAQKWLRTRHLTEAQDGALVAIGLDKIFRDIEKFSIPDDHSDGIGRAFKAWAFKCCKREWSKYIRDQKSKEGDIDQEDILAEEAPSPEDALIALETTEKQPSRAHAEIELMRRILHEELEKLPPSMKEALLESEDIKNIHQPNARGKQGEAAGIASKHGYKPGAVRTARSRLAAKVNERFGKEAK